MIRLHWKVILVCWGVTLKEGDVLASQSMMFDYLWWPNFTFGQTSKVWSRKYS